MIDKQIILQFDGNSTGRNNERVIVMHLDTDILLLKKIFKNYAEIQVVDGKIVLQRFTKKILSVFEAQSDGFKIRGRSTAGICMDVYTNSNYIKFNYYVSGMARNWLFFDVFVNDVLLEHIGTDEVQDMQGEFCYQIPKGKDMNRVTIYMPHIMEVSLSDITFSDGAIVDVTQRYQKNILCLGDSITQGMDSKYPSITYPTIVSNFLKMNLLNQGVGGYFFDEKVIDEELSFVPDLITVSYGTNDWCKYECYDDFYRETEKFLKKLVNTYQNTLIFVISPIWRADCNVEKPMGEFEGISKGLKHICHQFQNLSYINGMELVPNISSFYYDGQIHPNELGFSQYGLNLIKEILNKISE